MNGCVFSLIVVAGLLCHAPGTTSSEFRHPLMHIPEARYSQPSLSTPAVSSLNLG